MTERPSTNDAESNANWTRRTFLAAVGATGLAAASTGASAATDEQTNGCCCCNGGTADPIDDEELQALLDRLETAADVLEFPARRVGATPRGEQHGASRWGIHFRTDREIHLGEATVDAGESGTFTAVVARYDGGDRFDPVHERDITVDAGLNGIDLDMALDPGEYLLTRDGSFPLARAEWSGWESQSRDGLELIGGSKPGDWDKPNRYWYYFFDLNVAANEDAHL